MSLSWRHVSYIKTNRSLCLATPTGRKNLNSTESHAQIDMAASKVENGKLRSFGLILGACFAVVALWPAVFRSASPRTWALGLAVLLSGTALVYPPALRSFHRW